MFGDIMFGPGTGKAINDMMEEWQREMQRYNKAGASCPPPQQSGHSGVWSDAQQTWEQMQQWLAVDTSEDATSYYIRADVPGLSQKDLKLQLTPDNTLIISGERKRETESVDKEGARRFERRFGKFERKLRLPQDAQTEGIKAQTRDGVLTVTVPKQQPQEPEQQDNANRDIPIA